MRETEIHKVITFGLVNYSNAKINIFVILFLFMLRNTYFMCVRIPIKGV